MAYKALHDYLSVLLSSHFCLWSQPYCPPCHFSNMSSSHLSKFPVTVPSSWKPSFALPHPDPHMAHSSFPSGLWSNVTSSDIPICSLYPKCLCCPLTTFISFYTCSTFLHTSPVIVSYNNSFILFLCVSPTLMKTLWRWRHFLLGFSCYTWDTEAVPST